MYLNASAIAASWKTPAKVRTAPTVAASSPASFDKCDALLSLGEADTEGAVNTSLAKFITELDETQAVCDLIESNSLNISLILDGNDDLINTCD